MRKVIGLLAVVLATTGAAREEEALTETQAKLNDARAKMAEAARELAQATREQFLTRSDRAMLGVLIADQDERGVVVGGVTPDSGAEAAGVAAHDIITGINGEALTGLDRPGAKLREVLDGVESGQSVTLVLLRDGELSEVDVVTTTTYRDDLVPRFDFDWLPNVDVSGGFAALRDRFDRREHDLKLVDIGADLGAYFNVDAGVLVLDTPAKSALKPGDIVKRIDDADVGSAAEAYRLLGGDGEAVVQVWRRYADGVGVIRRNRLVDLTVPKLPRRGSVFVFSPGDGGDEHVEEVEIEVRKAQ